MTAESSVADDGLVDPSRAKVTWEQVISGHRSVNVNTGSTGTATLDSRVTGYLSAILMFALRDTVARMCSGRRDQGRCTTIFADELKLLAADSPEVIGWLRTTRAATTASAPLFATQRDDQLPPELLSSVPDLGTVLWFAQNNPDTAARAARDLAAGTGEGTWTPDEIINLPDHHCGVRASVRGRRQPAEPVHLTWFGDRVDQYPRRQGYPAPEVTAGPLAVDAPTAAGGSSPVTAQLPVVPRAERMRGVDELPAPIPFDGLRSRCRVTVCDAAQRVDPWYHNLWLGGAQTSWPPCPPTAAAGQVAEHPRGR